MSEELAHYGKKGMRWGVTTTSKGSSSSVGSAMKTKASSVKRRLDAMPPEQKRRAVIALVGTGAAVAAGIVAGPVGSMGVGGISRAVDAAFTTRTTTRTSTIDSFGNRTTSVEVHEGD